MAKVYLACLVLGCLAHADQLTCLKWKNADGSTLGTYCRPFSIKAGPNVAFANDELGRVLTITASGGGSSVPGQFVVDGLVYTTIQSAISAAAANTGSVLIPPNYAGVDSFTPSANVQINDQRPKANRQRGLINVLTDCGLRGDGTTDDATLAQTCLDTYQSHTFLFPMTQTGGACSYKFNATLFPKGDGTRIMGESGGYMNSYLTQGGTVLCFAAGVTGIQFDLGNGSGMVLENLSIQGSEGHHHLVTPTELNIPSGANLPLFNRTNTSIQRASNVLTVSTSKVSAVEGLTQQVGSTIKISGVTSDTTMNGLCIVATLVAGAGTATNPTQFTCAQNGADAGPFVEGTVGLPTTGASSADGIRICDNFITIKQVVVANFGRHGINADEANGCALPFSDDLIIRDSFFVGNQANGYLCNGVDCNAHLLSGNAFYYNVLWGVEDQSALGNTYIGNQLSNGGRQWAATSTPTTKNITSATRTSSTVAVVLASADTNIKLGSCVVIAGVTDSTFNTTAGQCFFVTSFTNSTHYSYIQPGAPGDASSSGGTSRMAKFSEAYLSAGVDSGAQKIQTQSAVAQPVIVNQYVEGGQDCKFGGNSILIGGANTPICATTTDWAGQFLSTQGCSGFGGSLCASLGTIWNNRDATHEVSLKAGVSSAQDVWFTWDNLSNLRSWNLQVKTTGTLGGTGYWHVRSQGVGQTRLLLFGKDTNNGDSYLNGEGSGKVIFGKNFSGSNAGTGGIEVDSGGSSPATVATIDGSGKGTLNGGLVVNNTAAPTVSANQIGLGSTTASTVGAAGAASALPATPSGYIIVNIGGTNFKIPYYAN